MRPHGEPALFTYIGKRQTGTISQQPRKVNDFFLVFLSSFSQGLDVRRNRSVKGWEQIS